MGETLSEIKEVQVRFNELDPMQIVWHGNYLRYFEDGREAFGEKYGLSYTAIRGAGMAAPVINVNCNYKKALQYPETILIETTYIPCQAAKLKLKYTIYRKGTNELMAQGETTQVFTDFEGNLLMCSPDFYTSWKQKWGVNI